MEWSQELSKHSYKERRSSVGAKCICVALATALWMTGAANVRAAVAQEQIARQELCDRFAAQIQKLRDDPRDVSTRATLSAEGSAAIRCLRPLLNESKEIKAAALLVIANIAVGENEDLEEDVIRDLAKLVAGTESPEIRTQAARALSNWGSRSVGAFDSLLSTFEGLQQDNPDMMALRVYAAAAIGNTARLVDSDRRIRAFRALMNGARSTTLQVRENSAIALSIIASACVQEDRGADRNHVLSSLVERLREELKAPRSMLSVQEALVTAIGDVAPGYPDDSAIREAVRQVKSLLAIKLDKSGQDPKKLLVRTAMTTLGRYGWASRDAIDALKELAEDPEYSYEAKSAIVAIRSDGIGRAYDALTSQTMRRALGVIVIVLVPALLLLVIYQVRPVWILEIFKVADGIGGELEFGKAKIRLTLGRAIGLQHLSTRDHVLDAWVSKGIRTARAHIRSLVEWRAPGQFNVYVEVDCPSGQVAAHIWTVGLMRELIGKSDSESWCLWLSGSAGHGKTHLALRIANWAVAENLDERILGHPMLPIIIDQDLQKVERKSDALLVTVAGQLKALSGFTQAPTLDFTEALLRRNRVLLIGDRWTQLSEDTRLALDPRNARLTAGALVIASREEPTGAPKIEVRLQPLDGETLTAFFQGYLRQPSARVTTADVRTLLRECDNFCALVGDEPISVLLAKLYIDDLVQSGGVFGRGPAPIKTIPDLALMYVHTLIPKGLRPRLVDIERDVRRLAVACVETELRARPISVSEAEAVLQEEAVAAEHLHWLEDALGLIERIDAGGKVRFILSPIAVWIAAREMTIKYGGEEEKWRVMFDRFDAGMSRYGSASMRDVLRAVRHCVMARGLEQSVPEFVLPQIEARLN